MIYLPNLCFFKQEVMVRILELILRFFQKQNIFFRKLVSFFACSKLGLIVALEVVIAFPPGIQLFIEISFSIMTTLLLLFAI